MTETVVVIEADRPVSEALDCFSQYPIHHLPVVRNGRLAGMISSADLMKLEFFAPKTRTDPARYLDERFRIDQIMRAPVSSLKSSASLADVAQLLIDTGVHAVPIVDDDERVLGIVSTTDIIQGFLKGPPRRGVVPPLRHARQVPAESARDEAHYHRKPTDAEFVTAMQAAETLHIEEQDSKYLGKAFLYLDQRREYLEKVLALADRFLQTGQDEHTHALLLKAIFAAKGAEEHASGAARVPFALE
jgi:CBS domain-containing protein